MVFFRIDLSNQDGLGHYNRVKSLIKYLDLKKYKIVIEKPKNISFFKDEISNIKYLYADDDTFKSEKQDAILFLKLIKNEQTKPIVIKDSYKLGFKWEKHIYQFCKKIISIDDFIERKHFADYYINHSPSFLSKNNKILEILKKKNKKNCTFLLGPEYALFNSNLFKIKKKVSDLVFYNGGSGDLLIYEKIIKRISRIRKKFFKIILIVGPLAKNYKTIFQRFKKYTNVEVLYQPKNILNVLVGTKVFISSAGLSIFESSFLKIPTLLFKINNNQNLSDFDYEKLGHYFSLEKKDLKYSNQIVKLIMLMLKNRIEIKKMMSKSSLDIKKIKKNYHKYFKF
jgi:spore coat polysaccharide biosynthesis predicted glycosyltransferase SpsG